MICFYLALLQGTAICTMSPPASNNSPRGNPVTNRQQPMDNIFFSSLILTRKKIMLPGIESEYRIKTSEKFAKFVLLWNRFIECWIDRIISASFFFNSQLLVGLLDTGKDGLTSCKTFGSFVWMVF